ncbi:anti-sigma factor [Nonomuraea sp. NPDC050786]|uniref:anti-sigma factor n=1 Tax=Nonomuraea sp. NPDC050786 TaxID=3154840 RepID=UPI0033DF0B93
MTDGLHTLSGAYAVHALPYAEWVLFEEHLVACQVCGTEVRRLRETAARLATVVAAPPPAALRPRLLAAAHDSRRPAARPDQVPDDSPAAWRPPQLVVPPERGPENAPTLALPPQPPPVPPVPASSPTVRVPAAPWQPAPTEPPEVRAVLEEGRVVPFRRGRSKALAGLAAVAAAAAVAFGAVAIDARRDQDDLAARNREVAAVLAAPDAETVRRPVTAGGTATVVISRSRGRMVFASSGLPRLPGSKGYELWLMGRDGPRPAGMLGPAEDGVTTPLLVTPEREDDRVALTVEPAAGSGRPTTRPILLADLPGA